MTFIKMESYTIQQRVQIVELFYINRRLMKNIFRKLRDIYGLPQLVTKIMWFDTVGLFSLELCEKLGL